MPESYYKPCRELDICNELIEKYFNTQQYENYLKHLNIVLLQFGVQCWAGNIQRFGHK